MMLRRVSQIGAALVVLTICAVAAWWMVGPAPKPADEGFPKSPPPLALPDDVPERSLLGRSAALLAVDDLDGARKGFTTVVAEDRSSEAGQVGLVLSRWRSTGAISVERDLRQLAREYPDSAFVALHLGMVQSLIGDARAARSTLRAAISLGYEAADPTSWRMGLLASDLLNPQAFRGLFPVLVSTNEVPASDRDSFNRMLRAMERGDRRSAATIAEKLMRSDDYLLRVAAASVLFDKNDPSDAVNALDKVAADARAGKTARDRARMLAALARAWAGSGRESACPVLKISAMPATEKETRRLASKISAELCKGA